MESSIYMTFFLLLLDEHGAEMKLAMVTYQFDEEEHAFVIKSHANSKEKAPYRRKQDSTFKATERKVVVEKPRQVFQSVAESSGDGLF